MESNDRLIQLVTANTPQSQLFADYLRQQLDCQGRHRAAIQHTETQGGQCR